VKTEVDKAIAAARSARLYRRRRRSLLGADRMEQVEKWLASGG